MYQKESVFLLCLVAILFHTMCFAQQNGDNAGLERPVLDSRGVAEILNNAGPSSGIGLPSALKKALKDNPQFLFSHFDFASSKANWRAEYGNLFPQLDLSASFGAISSEFESESDSAMTNRQRLVLSQLIYDGGITSSNVNAAEYFSESKKYQHFKKAESVALMATQSFFEVIRNRGLIELCKQNIFEHVYIVELTRIRLSSGGGSRADVSQAEAALEEARSRLIQARQGLADAEAAYVEIFGLAPGSLSMPERLVNAVPSSSPQGAALALSNDNALKAAELGLKQKGEGVKSAKGVFMPRVSVELSAEHSNNVKGFSKSYNDLTGLLDLDYNLFNGGSDRESIRKARHEQSKARQEVARVRREVVKDMENAYNFYMATWELVPVLKEAVDKNAEVVAGYAYQFRLGKRSLLDLVSAQNALFNSQQVYLNGHVAHTFSHYRILAPMSALLKNLGILVDESGNWSNIPEDDEDD
jgi:adhesin transport system outer membrane protein